MPTEVRITEARLKDDAKVTWTHGVPIAEFVVVVEDKTWRAGSSALWTETSYIGVIAVLPKFDGEEDTFYRGDQVTIEGVIGQYEDSKGRRHTKVRANRDGLQLVRRGPVGRGEESAWTKQPDVEPF